MISDKNIFSSSNFLRSVILSNYFFDQNDIKNNVNNDCFFTKTNKICSFVKSKYDNIFFSLISKIQIKDLNQQNLNVVNLILIFFILEYLNQNLSKFLTQIREKYKEQIYLAFKNFIQILQIWKDYYNFRTKDSSFLQNITNIPFNTFLRVTDILINENKNDICSLYYK